MTYQQAMAADSRLLNIRGTITLADETVIPLTNEHIMAYAIDEGANEIPLGGAPSASYTLELANADGEWFPGGSIIGLRALTGARVAIEIGVHHDGSYEYKPAGVWYVHKPGGKEGGTRFIMRGHDALLTTYDDPLDDSGFAYGPSSTLGGLLNHIKTKHGLTINGALACNAGAVIAERPDWGAGCTVRNALAFIAAAGGCFVQVDRAGALRFVPVKSPSAAKAIDTASYLELENANARFTFNRLKVMPRGATQDTPYTEGAVNTGLPEAGNNTLVMTDNPLFAAGASNLQAMVNALTTALSGYAVHLLSYRHRGDPTLELGDTVTVTDRRAGVTTSPVLQQSIKYGPGMSATVSSMISLEMMQPSAISRNGTLSPIAFGKGSLDPSVLIAKSITSQYIAANTITADEIDVGSLEAVLADIVDARIGTADIDWAHIKDLVTDTAIITQGVGGQLYIARLAVTEANMVSLTVGEMIVKGSDGNFYAVVPDGSGGVTTQLKQVTGSNMANATIPGGKLIENTITARELNVQNIFADTAIIRQLMAANLDVDTLFGRTATINHINAIDIRSNSYLQIALDDKASITMVNDAITLAVNNIRVGGTNLRPESIAVISTSPGVTVTESTSFVEAGTKSWQVNLSGLGTQYIRLTHGISFVAGQTYTLSCVVRAGYSISNVRYVDNNGDSVEVTYTNDAYLAKNSGYYSKVIAQFTPVVSGVPTHGLLIYFDNSAVSTGSIFVSAIKLEKGTQATDWSPSPDDPASGVKTSHIDIASDHIDISSGGNITINAGGNLNVRGGSGTSAFGISTNIAGDYMLWGGHGTPASAPLYLLRNGGAKMGGFIFRPNGNFENLNRSIYFGQWGLAMGGNLNTDPQADNFPIRLQSDVGYIWSKGYIVRVNNQDRIFLESNGNIRAAGSITGNLGVLDTTPAYTGLSALEELRWVEMDEHSDIDHSTLPPFAQQDLEERETTPEGSEVVRTIPARNLGSMVSILTRGVQELLERIESIEEKINA